MNQYWSTKTDKLIEMLRDHSYLWDQSHPQYRNKAMREYGFATIANELNVTTTAIKHKITNLKSKYKSEIQKINSAKKLGFFYKPLLPWFNDFRDLMESVQGPRDSVPLLSEVNMLKGKATNVPTPHDHMEESSQEEEEDSGEEPDIIEELENSDTIVVSISQEYIDEVNKAQKNVNVAPKSFKKRTQKPSPRKGQVIDPSNIVIEHSEEPRRDEFQMFAEHIAEQLKMMPIELAMELQNNIQRMIDEVDDTN